MLFLSKVAIRYRREKKPQLAFRLIYIVAGEYCNKRKLKCWCFFFQLSFKFPASVLSAILSNPYRFLCVPLLPSSTWFLNQKGRQAALQKRPCVQWAADVDLTSNFWQKNLSINVKGAWIWAQYQAVLSFLAGYLILGAEFQASRLLLYRQPRIRQRGKSFSSSARSVSNTTAKTNGQSQSQFCRAKQSFPVIINSEFNIKAGLRIFGFSETSSKTRFEEISVNNLLEYTRDVIANRSSLQKPGWQLRCYKQIWQVFVVKEAADNATKELLSQSSSWKCKVTAGTIVCLPFDDKLN